MNNPAKAESTPRKPVSIYTVALKIQNSVILYSLTTPKGWQIYVQEMNGWINKWAKQLPNQGYFLG